MGKIPDKEEHRRRFAALSMQDRRKVLRAVNRGQVVEDRKLAPLVIGVARRQQRFWRVAWLLGPLAGLTGIFTERELRFVLINIALVTVVMAAMAVYSYTRASRALALNTEIALGRGGRDRSRYDASTSAQGATDRFRSHLPGASRATKPAPSQKAAPRAPERAAETPDDGQPAEPDAPVEVTGTRPYKPRGRKRR